LVVFDRLDGDVVAENDPDGVIILPVGAAERFPILVTGGEGESV
jgi:hypothetical protein